MPDESGGSSGSSGGAAGGGGASGASGPAGDPGGATGGSGGLDGGLGDGGDIGDSGGGIEADPIDDDPVEDDPIDEEIDEELDDELDDDVEEDIDEDLEDDAEEDIEEDIDEELDEIDDEEIEEPEEEDEEEAGAGQVGEEQQSQIETYPGHVGTFTVEHPPEMNEPAKVIYWDENGLPQADFAIPQQGLEEVGFLDMHRMFYKQEKAIQGDEMNEKAMAGDGNGIAQPIIDFLDDRLDDVLNNVTEQVQGSVRNPDMSEMKEQSKNDEKQDKEKDGEKKEGDEEGQQKKDEKEANQYAKRLQEKGYSVKRAAQARNREELEPKDMSREQLEQSLMRSLRRVAKLRREGQQKEEELGEAFESYNQLYEQQIEERTQELKMRQIIPEDVIENRSNNEKEAKALNQLHDQVYGPAAQQPKNVQEKREEKTAETKQNKKRKKNQTTNTV